MEYLLAELDRPNLKIGSRLPTTRQIAADLQLSVPTVHNVFRKLAKEGRIRSEVGNGTFLVSAPSKARSQVAIALGFWQPASSPTEVWGYRIYGGMLNAAMSSAKAITLLPLPRQEGGNLATLQQKLLNELSEVKGLIQFPYGANSEEIRLAFEAANKPVVNLNPPSELATSNFISPDFYGASYQLGKAWKQTGRRRVLLMLGWPAERSVSSRLRLAGLVNGLGLTLGDGISCHVVSVTNPEQYDSKPEDGYNAMGGVLEGTDLIPDAVYCHGDPLAVGAVQALREAGLDAPRDVSVVGGSGIDLANLVCPGLTATYQPLEKMGEELVKMLCQRIESGPKGAVSLPGKFLPMPFVGGATTRAEENVLLRINDQ
ncbi:MAG: substrate-binding domain-containing protein [Verrucomicrobia bacterium]|nr:substrate-binding domain-containing protein [Verrucomicrobiota bacterium]